LENDRTAFTCAASKGDILRIPIAHGEGNYYNFEGDIKKLEDSGRVLFRYVDEHGQPTPSANPNGSIDNIAGIINEEGNVAGMMPHPERAVETILGSVDGLKIFDSVRATCKSTNLVGEK
jgi:phosphoribosylformylglycinamidine synthase